MKKQTKDATIIVRVREPINRAIETDAQLHAVKKSEIIRRALLLYLIREGYNRENLG